MIKSGLSGQHGLINACMQHAAQFLIFAQLRHISNASAVPAPQARTLTRRLHCIDHHIMFEGARFKGL